MLFRGGRRDADVLLAEFDAVGDGVEDILIAASSADMSEDISSFTIVFMWIHAELSKSNIRFQNPTCYFCRKRRLAIR